jgi:REP element-mobilizing transposase RayT
MPQSHACLLVHIVFSTKGRAPVLTPTIRPRLHAYLGTITRNLACEDYRSGGTADHVHLAIRISRILTVAKLVEELKTTSSKWLKLQSPALANFAWQRGYGAFTLAPSGLLALFDYIDNQSEHHRTKTFQDEYRTALTDHGMDYDERYVWD